MTMTPTQREKLEKAVRDSGPIYDSDATAATVHGNSYVALPD